MSDHMAEEVSWQDQPTVLTGDERSQPADANEPARSEGTSSEETVRVRISGMPFLSAFAYTDPDDGTGYIVTADERGTEIPARLVQNVVRSAQSARISIVVIPDEDSDAAQ